MEKLDLIIVNEFAKGKKYEEISLHLKKVGISPNSVRTIENVINKLKKDFRAKTLFHLAIILKRREII